MFTFIFILLALFLEDNTLIEENIETGENSNLRPMIPLAGICIDLVIISLGKVYLDILTYLF